MKEEDLRTTFRKDSLSAEIKNCIKQTTKSRSKRRKFNLGSVNIEYDLIILKKDVSTSMSMEYSYKKRTLCDLDPLLSIEWDMVRGVMSYSFVTSVKVNITLTLSNKRKGEPTNNCHRQAQIPSSIKGCPFTKGRQGS